MSILQLKITLKHVEPKVSRTILIESDTDFEELAMIIMDVMGWEGYHLHQFRVGRECYQPESEYLKEDDYAKAYDDLVLSDLLPEVKSKMIFEYDFGDGWEHEIFFQKTVPVEIFSKYPRCIKGQNACPPEDCGGPWGYSELLETLEDKKHPDHADMREWLGLEKGEKFDPTYFDLDEANERIQ
jgi:Plasmid pRiA4b ORF-3-like protein